MKQCISFFIATGVLLFPSSVLAVESITVDTSHVLSNTQRKQVGINSNYLLDDNHNWLTARPIKDAFLEMGAKYIRYPGGEKSDIYLWSVPPFTQSQPTLARIGTCEWPSGDSNFMQSDLRTFKIDPLDFDEFITLAKSVGAEPVIVVAYDSMYKSSACGGITPTRQQLLDTAVAWVRYANITKKYNVKYWELGNESYMNHFSGTATASNYANDLKVFSQAMKAIDPSIKIGANGHESSWWNTILSNAGSAIDFLVVHEYPSYTWGNYDYYRTHIPDLTPETRVAINALNTYASSSDRSRLKIAITEMNSYDWATDGWPHINNLGHSLVLFEMIGEYLTIPQVDFSMLWTTHWETKETTALGDGLSTTNNLKPTTKVISLWQKHLKDVLVSTTKTAFVRSFATKSNDGKTGVVFLLNKDTSSKQVTVIIKNFATLFSVNRSVYKGNSPEDLAPTITQGSSLTPNNNVITLTTEPLSITVLEFSTAPTPTVSGFPSNPAVKHGDANNDGKVDGIDFSIWLSRYGQSTTSVHEAGDFNRDGKVDGIDFTIWLTNYEK